MRIKGDELNTRYIYMHTDIFLSFCERDISLITRGWVMIHPWAVIDPLFYQRERKQLGDSFVEDHNRRMAEDEERERRGAAAERERRAAEAEAFAVNSRGKGLIGACNNSWVMI